MIIYRYKKKPDAKDIVRKIYDATIVVLLWYNEFLHSFSYSISYKSINTIKSKQICHLQDAITLQKEYQIPGTIKPISPTKISETIWTKAKLTKRQTWVQKTNYKKIFDWVKRNPIRTRIHELWPCHYVSLTLNLKLELKQKSSWPSWRSISCYDCQVQVLQPWSCYLCTNASLWEKFCTGVSIKEKMKAWYNNSET